MKSKRSKAHFCQTFLCQLIIQLQIQKIMKTCSVICLFIIVQIATQFKTQRLIFQASPQTQTQPQVQIEQDQEQPETLQARKLLTITRNPIRITLDSSAFNTITPGPSGSTTTTNLAFILRAMQVAVNFYSTRLQVYPLSSLIAPGICVDYTPSLNDQQFGIGASDLHIYVLYITDSSQGYGATGKSCLWFAHGQSPPDNTLQLQRPIMGRIIFNTYNLIDTQTSLTNVLFQSISSTAIHQTLHILGFDSSLYNTWLISDQTSPSFGNVYTNPKVTSPVNSNRPTTYFLTTPGVTAWARSFFNCSSMVGMVLENQDSTSSNIIGSGSHWQRVAMYDELMTGTSMGTTIKYFSGLTFEALKDMGWYTVDDTFNETSNYGYQRGCSFIIDACYGSTSFPQFCNPVTTSTISGCQTDFLGKAVCTNQSGSMSDGCGFMGPYTNCMDPASTDVGYASYTFQAVGINSFCIYSTLGTVALPSTLTSRCYPYQCNSNNVTFTVGSYTITCLSNQTNVSKTLSSMTGVLYCPDFFSFCKHTRKTCSNWCSQNGYCMGGVCNCLSGYYGNDCSKIGCTSGTYWDPTTSSCVTLCPSKYYQNKYSRSCQPCDSSCDQCYGQPTICTNCTSTASNPKYFYNGTCYSTCPDGTYTNGYQCSNCDATVFCKTCSLSATNCTSCSPDTSINQTKYLNQPGWGTCINACPVSGSYVLTDVVNFVCVMSCANNLIQVNGTCNYCQNGTYKFIANSTCISFCPNYYYADSVQHICAQCDSSCLTCSGAYAQNCTSCSPAATLRYWLLSMCWATCPGGYYPNNTDSNCYLCPTNLNCGTCSYSSSVGSVICTSCVYNTFFQQSSYSCLSACNATQYGNKANNTCMICDSSCLSCSGAGPSQCTTCSGTLLVQNLTGSYCVASCNPIGYTQSGANCMPCDLTCYTCSGTSSSECTSCPNSTFLTNQYCLYVCPPASYPNSTINKCLSCDGSCTFCFGPTIDNCTGCISGMVLYNFTCTLTCPAGYSLNQWNVCFQPYWLGLSLLWVSLMIVMI